MRVVVPYAASDRDARIGLYPAVRAALEADGVAAEYVDVSGSPTAYHELLAGLWREGQAFTVIEHDVVVRPGAIAELDRCPERWCCAVYRSAVGPLIGGLGCTRFSGQLLQEHPAVFRTIDHLPPDGTPRHYWGRLDTRLKIVLMQSEGVTPHAHYGLVDYHRSPDYAMQLTFNCDKCGAVIPPQLYTEMPPPYPCARCS